jgi:hypothetical protein
MIAEAEAAEGGPTLDFVRLLRVVADSRHVSVHDLLWPPVRETYVMHPDWGRPMPRLDFEPYDGWSWRELLVWASDAVRQMREREQAEADAAWRAQAHERLRVLQALES